MRPLSGPPPQLPAIAPSQGPLPPLPAIDQGPACSRTKAVITASPLPPPCSYGKHFGQGYFLADLVDSVPRVRVRTSQDRARDQLADLAVLNERLAGRDGADAAAIRCAPWPLCGWGTRTWAQPHPGRDPRLQARGWDRPCGAGTRAGPAPALVWRPGVATTARPWTPLPLCRQRLEHMKLRRRNWELVYQHVTRADALCTLGAIEEANARVEELLSEESRERHSVSGG